MREHSTIIQIYTRQRFMNSRCVVKYITREIYRQSLDFFSHLSQSHSQLFSFYICIYIHKPHHSSLPLLFHFSFTALDSLFLFTFHSWRWSKNEQLQYTCTYYISLYCRCASWNDSSWRRKWFFICFFSFFNINRFSKHQ